jgi:hypothetical protein
MFCNFYQHFQLSSKFKSLASFLLSNPPPLRGAPRTANPAPTFFFLQRELFILVIAQENVSGFIECQWFGSISFYFLFFIFYFFIKFPDELLVRGFSQVSQVEATGVPLSTAQHSFVCSLFSRYSRYDWWRLRNRGRLM